MRSTAALAFYSNRELNFKVLMLIASRCLPDFVCASDLVSSICLKLLKLLVPWMSHLSSSR